MLQARRALFLLILSLLPAAARAQQARTPVLVELFTSEGCSSCPPADARLAHLLRDQPVPNAEIIALEEHVDYWDSLGWHDRFSSHLLTDRQSQYTQRLHADDNYTPQMIVDGADQFVGNDTAQALHAIAAAARTPKPTLTLSFITTDANHIAAAVSLTSAAPQTKASLYAAVIQPTASTQVQRGENGGRTLNHVSVVRSLQRIGSLSEAAPGPLRFSLPTPADAAPATLRIVVFAQRDGQGSILAAVSSSRAPTAMPTNSVASAYPLTLR
jgi:hypothetical protein